MRNYVLVTHGIQRVKSLVNERAEVNFKSWHIFQNNLQVIYSEEQYLQGTHFLLLEQSLFS